MNENLNLVEILKDCPIGTEFYHSIYNKVYFVCIDLDDSDYPIRFSLHTDCLPNISITKNGKHIKHFDGDCVLYPNKDQRDWSKFTAPWYKKERFDPKTLKPFDKVLIRRSSENYNVWFPDFVSDPPNDTNNKTLCMCVMEDISMVIPYNDETKHLFGTSDEAPEYYRYWED